MRLIASRHWCRFGLRTLFGAVTLTAAACYWFARPSILAHQFARAIASGDYDTAESMFLDSKYNVPRDFGDASQLSQLTIVISPISFHEFLARRRYIQVQIPYGDEPYEWDWNILVISTPRGLQVFMIST